MKSLDQIEPRIDLQATPPPVGVDTSNPNYHFLITQPGSYYLSRNLGVTKPNGIQINAENVALDLHGFEISRTSGSGGNGVGIAAASHHASVRNGSIKGFNGGVRCILDSPGYARGCAFRDLSVSGCTGDAILVGSGAVVDSCRVHNNSGNSAITTQIGSSLTNCTAAENTTFYGIIAGAGSSLINCTADFNTGAYALIGSSACTFTNCASSNNTATYGIAAGAGSALTNCTSSFNNSANADSGGITAEFGSTLNHCSSYNNNSSAATSTNMTGTGIEAAAGCIVVNCTAYSNEGDGIRVSSDATVRECQATLNGDAGDGAGVHATGNGNRIDGNTVTSNDRGLDVDGTENLVIRNSARNNGANYSSVGPGNSFGPVVAVADPITNMSPWANFTF